MLGHVKNTTSDYMVISGVDLRYCLISERLVPTDLRLCKCFDRTST